MLFNQREMMAHILWYIGIPEKTHYIELTVPLGVPYIIDYRSTDRIVNLTVPPPTGPTYLKFRCPILYLLIDFSLTKYFFLVGSLYDRN